MKTGLGSKHGLISFSSSFLKLLVAVAVAGALLLLTACGGGGSTPPPPPAPTVTFTSTAPAAASEGQAYTYQISATESSGAAVTYSLTSGPDGAAISGSTLSWTPTHAQSRKSNSFTIKGTSSKGATATQTFSVAPIGTINGKGDYIAIGSQGTVLHHYDATMGTLLALVPNGSGQYTTITAVGKTDGTFTIAGVPAGYFWLQAGSYYFWMNGNDIDLSQILFGRINGPIANPAATINFDVTLTTVPTADERFFGWYVPNVGYLDSAMPVGTLASTEWTYAKTWGGPSNGPMQLLDADQGDVGYFFRRHQSDIGDLFASVIGETYAATSMHMTSGGTVNVTGNATAVTQDMTFRGKIDGSAFAALHPAITPHPGPGTVGSQHAVYVRAQPYTAQHGNMANDPGIPPLLMISSNTVDTLFQTDRDMGDIAYGNPFLEPSTKYVQVMDYLSISEAGGYIAGGYGTVTTAFPTATQSIRPVIGPVSSPKIDGQDIFTCSSGCALNNTPTISWTQPTLGNADYYAVLITDFSANSHFSFCTTSTTMTVPPGILQSGKHYFVVIGAYSSPNSDYSKPLIQAFPHSWASAIASFTTPGTAPAVSLAEQDAVSAPREEVIDMFGAPVVVKRGGE